MNDELMPREELMPLRAELKPTDEIRVALREGGGVLAVAQACVVDSQDMAELANDELRGVKDSLKKLEAMHKAFVLPAKKIIDAANGMFQPAMNALSEAETVYKGKLIDWTAEQQRFAAAARRVAEQAERKARAEAQAKAAAEQARAEQEAAEKRRQAAAQDELRRNAEAEGNTRAAAAAAAKAAKANSEAESMIAIAVQHAIEAELSVPPVFVPVPIAAPKGFSTRNNWVADLADGVTEDRAIVMIAAAITSGRADLINLLKLDMSTASKLAKALEQNMNVPGLVPVNRPVAASRAA